MISGCSEFSRTTDAVAIGIEASYRNTSLAILIKASLFPAIPGVADPFADQVLFVALLYAGFAMMVAMLPLFVHRWMDGRAGAEAGG